MRCRKVGLVVATMALALPAGAQATVRFESQAARLGYSPSGVLLGDTDQDRQSDALGADQLATRAPDGRFRPSYTWVSPFTAYPVLLADYDHNGSLDVLTETYAGTDQCDIRVYKGSGFGSFSAPVVNSVGATCQSVWNTADVNNDGVATDWFGAVYSSAAGAYYWYSPDYGYALMGGTAAPIRVASADVNGDKLQDWLALTNDGSIRQSLRQANGTFGPAITVPGSAGAQDLAAGDLTGDSKAEIVTINSSTVTTWTGTGTTTSFTIPGGGGQSVALGDVDGDGTLDMLIGVVGATTSPPNAVLVRMNTGTGSFAPPVTFASVAPYRLSVGRRPDGRVDVVGATNYYDTTLLVNRSTATAGFAPSSLAFATTAAGQQSAPSTINFRNVGDDVLRVDHAHLSGLDADSFVLVSDGCQGAVLSRNQTCPISLRFAPKTVGAKTAAIRVLHSGDGAASQATLTGTGAPPTALTALTAPGALAGRDGRDGRDGRNGRDGRDGVLRCVAGTQVCAITLASSPSVRQVRAELRRNGRVLARASGRAGVTLKLRAKRRLKAGHYRLRVVRTYRSGKRTVKSRIVLVR
jgi:hypothetical protein